MSSMYDLSYGRVHGVVENIRAKTLINAEKELTAFLHETAVEYIVYHGSMVATDIVIYPKNDIENNFVTSVINMCILLADNYSFFTDSISPTTQYHCFDNIMNTHYSFNIIVDNTHYDDSI